MGGRVEAVEGEFLLPEDQVDLRPRFVTFHLPQTKMYKRTHVFTRPRLVMYLASGIGTS